MIDGHLPHAILNGSKQPLQITHFYGRNTNEMVTLSISSIRMVEVERFKLIYTKKRSFVAKRANVYLVAPLQMLQIWDANTTFSVNPIEEVPPIACKDGDVINVHVSVDEAVKNNTTAHNRWNVDAHNLTGFKMNDKHWKFRNCDNTWTETSSNGIMTWKEYHCDANVIYLSDTDGRGIDIARIDLNKEQAFYCSAGDCYSYRTITELEVGGENTTIDTDI